ncbi:S-adenosyl-L-methionine-dependent methyltransferase [Macrolepiota fuliginosa MF-IS2]|uniref:S-adenosyl-L-methionine-dependent methyltransferase n=1 Tax=Macrolepiota fuliginosa MF-IS2 TaxID=1400762 RepID=A0A9P5XPE8_9AGAR|nr:S-adenosyl-L-methionine-dependent methyltransferase [Macrolepiota fuliginosa MF-IS2]
MSNVEDLYKLPHDVQELNRLDVQHRMWLLMVGGLYPSELSSVVERLMTSGTPRIMDVGCGSGIWAVEMAKQFPQAEVIGIDITPLKLYRPIPPNFIFRQQNLAGGLPIEYTNQFDIIHCRCVCQHVPDPQRLIDDIVRCLKPGGLALIPDGEWVAFDEDRKPLEPFVYNPSLSIEENIMNTRKLSAYGGWLNAFGRATLSPTYQFPNLLLENNGGVRNIMFREHWAPTGWAGKGIPHGEEIGAIMYLNLKEFLQTASSAITNQGVPIAVVDALRERATEELNERRHNVWYYTSAVALDAPHPKL